MSIRLANLRQHQWVTRLLVVLLALRALIPVGFMPTGDGRLALQICPEGFPVALLHQAGGHHHQHTAPQPSVHDHAGPQAPVTYDREASQLATAERNGPHAPSHEQPGQHPPAHDHKSWMQGHCPFGAAAGAPGACGSFLVTVGWQPTVALPQTVLVPAPRGGRFLIAQPRAPPINLA